MCPPTERCSWYHTVELSRTWVLLVVAIIAVFVRRLKSTIELHAITNDYDTINERPLPESKLWIDAGERPITNSDEDLFSRTEISSKIVGHLQNNERSIALLGTVGSGKTSIVNLACELLMISSSDAIVVKSDLWRARDAKAMPQIVIDDIVRGLDRIVDTTSIRDMSLAYARFAAAEPSGYLQRILGARKRTDSLHQLDKLCSLLEAIDRRLILIVEDLDRVHETFNIAHISRFLWAIREIDRCYTVISIDPSRTELDYGKLCDCMEVVPLLSIQLVADTLGELYQIWTSMCGDIDPNIHRDTQDKFGLRQIGKKGLQAYLLNETHSTPIRMLTTMLSTPRSLKHVLRRIDNVWEELHGEVEIDDLIILSALRHSAPSTYHFIIMNIEIARANSDGLEKGSLGRFKDRWNAVLEEENHPHAVRILVDLLGIEQLRSPDGPNPVADKCPQGVHVGRSPDYLARIVSGQMKENEVRDQHVLHDIEEWGQTWSRDAESHNLIDRVTFEDDYRAAWEHFHNLSQEEFMHLFDKVITLLVKRHGPNIDPDDPALRALARKAYRRPFFSHHPFIEGWLQLGVSRNVCESLSLTCGLIKFCILVKDKQKDHKFQARLTQIVLDEISKHILSPDQLIQALSLQYPYTVSTLLFHISTPSEAAKNRLVSLILESLPLSDHKVLLQLAYLVDSHSKPKEFLPRTEPIREAFDIGIDLERVGVLFGGYESFVLESLSKYSGSNATCKDIASAASEALKSFGR